MSRRYTLGRSERLKSRKDIEQVFSEGKKFMCGPYMIIHRLLPAGASPGLLFGVAVPTKNFKKAVDRNRIKRLTRESYRLQKLLLQEKARSRAMQLHVFFIFTGKELPLHEDVFQKVGLALEKLNRLIP